jgi:hypothetical protein
MEEWKEFSEAIKKMANEGFDTYSLKEKVERHEELSESYQLLLRFCKTKRGDWSNINCTGEDGVYCKKP